MAQEKFLEACIIGDLDILKSLDYSEIDIHDEVEEAFRWTCCNGHLDVVKYLISLEPDHGRINIHANDEYAFRWACENGQLNVVKFLLSLEPDHGCINIHANDEFAFRFACQNGHLNVVKFLLTMEPDHGRIDIHVYDDHIFRYSNFHIRHQLVHRDPTYNWKKVYGYKAYREDLEQLIDGLTTLHQIIIHHETDILELNVIYVVEEFLLV